MNRTWSDDTKRLDEPALPSLPEDRLYPDQVLEGGYRVQRQVGSGAMGVVYRGWDACLERPVAIKVMRTARLSSPIWREQFVAEARAMARVRHPNVVEVYHLGFLVDTPYIIMEYVDGRSLTAWLKSRPTDLPLDEALAVLDTLCLGTQAIHESGAVHGDLKPGNVLVSSSGRVAITDFGLAHPIGADVSSWGVHVAGTPAYLAPEVAARAHTAAELVSRADVYSLGVIAYELLTGSRPFQGGSTSSLLEAHMHSTPMPASERRPDCPEVFDEVLRCALAKKPEQRFQSPRAFRRALMRARASIRVQPSKGSVLIVDDDEHSRGYTAYLLRRHAPRLEIVEASDGASALEKLGGRAIDLVLADLNMPIMDGAMLVDRLRSNDRTRTIPIVVVTGHGGARQWRELRTKGVDDFLVKPFDDGMLWSTVSRFL
jgi:eukaryotic-like serine/threonine-protein kinase